ncbi:MAG: hypothetical protein AB7C96_04570 [Hydrogenovibrio sp.]
MKIVLQRLALSTLFTLISLPAFSADNRTVVWLNEEEQAMLLSEMRQFLVASQKILAASLKDDMETVEATARNVGIQQMRSTPPSLRAKLPKGFKALGPKVHRGFEDIANEAETLGDSTVILERLAQLQKNCIACHAAYRVKATATLTEK